MASPPTDEASAARDTTLATAGAPIGGQPPLVPRPLPHDNARPVGLEALAQAASNPDLETTGTFAFDFHNTPVVEKDGRRWFRDGSMELGLPPVAFREWGMKTPLGDLLEARCDPAPQRSRLDYFLLMFPPKQLKLMISEANRWLGKEGKELTNEGEYIRFLGVWILVTRFKFGERRSLWSATSHHKYLPPANFGATGMVGDRFDLLWQCTRFSRQPDE